MAKRRIPEIIVQLSPKRFAVCGAPTVVNGVAYYEPRDDIRFRTLLEAVVGAQTIALTRQAGRVQTAAPVEPAAAAGAPGEHC